jgi:FkbM family methyltransferase
VKEFVSSHAPLRSDGKIAIPLNLKHVKLDVGLSYNAPHSQYWLENEENLFVIGFEPNLSSVNSIRKGAVKLDPSHGKPLNPKYLGEKMFIIPCALGLTSGEFVRFYITENDCGRSSLYPPKTFAVAQTVEVPVFTLSDFFELFPFDSHPIIDYIKIDAQGSDLDIIKGAGPYLTENVVYITIEAEDHHYENTQNSYKKISSYMKSIGFERIESSDTQDPTFFNPRFSDYIRDNLIKIYQNG